MAFASVSGIVSGLDTATIISQLMQVEAQPQTLLKSKVSATEKAVSALQALNTKLAGLATKAGDLAKLTGWSPTKATSSNEFVTVNAASGAAISSLTFQVSGLASSYRATYTQTGTLDQSVMAADLSFEITFTDGRPAQSFSTGDGKLQTIADKINASGDGVRATLVKTGLDSNNEPVYQLQLASSATGAKSDFAITQTGTATPAALLGGVATSSAGSDASITIAGQSQPLTSASNTFEDLMPGVDVALGAKAEGSVTIDIARDGDSVKDSVKAMVDAVNAALEDIDEMSSYDAGTKKAGILAGDSTLRDVRNALLATVTNAADGTSLAEVGIQLDRYGRVTFDEEKFAAAYTTNPTSVMNKFTSSVTENGTLIHPDGFAARVAAVAERASDSYTGTITSAIKGRTSSVDDMEEAIADWDIRLELRRQTLTRQFTAMEVALGQLQSQSSWLAGQISSLPQINSGS